MNFKLDIIDSQRKIYSGDAFKLTIPAARGEMTVLANHMPIVTPIGLGEIAVVTPNKKISLTVGKGVFSFINNYATLLVEDTSYSEEISESLAMEAKRRAEEIIQKGIQGPDFEAALETIKRSNLDLKVVRKRKFLHN